MKFIKGNEYYFDSGKYRLRQGFTMVNLDSIITITVNDNSFVPIHNADGRVSNMISVYFDLNGNSLSLVLTDDTFNKLTSLVDMER